MNLCDFPFSMNLQNRTYSKSSDNNPKIHPNSKQNKLHYNLQCFPIER